MSESKPNDALQEAAALYAKERSENVVRKIRIAMCTITEEIEKNEGLYILNSGRLTQAEVCRRAGVANITLYSPAHKSSTKIEVDTWIKKFKLRRKPEIKKAINQRADFWKREHSKVADQICLYELLLVEKNIQIKKITEEKDLLKKQLLEKELNEKKIISLYRK
jgi:hypothetical protein